MPGFPHPQRSAIAAVALFLAAMSAAGVTHRGPSRPAGHAAAAVGSGAAATPSAHPGALSLGADRGLLQPGGPVTGPRGAAAPTFSRLHSGLASSNWAGYATTETHRPFRFVEAVFFVPYIDCAATPGSFSAHWVGMDGISTTSVEQAGVLASCRGAAPEYTAWWEMFPRLPVYQKLTVRPGDSIVASVYYRQAGNRFVLSLTDTTTGRRFSVARACPTPGACPRASAEVISEAPSSGGRVQSLTDYRAMSFSSITVTDQAGQRSGMRSRWWSYTPITMVSPATGAVLAQPTQLYRGSAFETYWERES